MDQSRTSPPQEAVPFGPSTALAAPSSAPPRVWPTFAGVVAIAVLGQLVGGLALGVLWFARREAGSETTVEAMRAWTRSEDAAGPALVAGTLGLQLALLAGTLFAAARSPIPLARRLSLRRPASGLEDVPAFAISTAALSLIAAFFGLLAYIGIFGPPSEEQQELNRLMFTVLDGAQAWLALLLVAVTPAVCEELLFRGFAQTRLVQRFGPAVGILIAAALFAALHANPIQSFVVFPVGVLFGILAWASRSIVPAMAAHALYNASVLSFSKAVPTLVESGAAELSSTDRAWLSIPLFVVLFGLLLAPRTLYRLLRA